MSSLNRLEYIKYIKSNLSNLPISKKEKGTSKVVDIHKPGS